MNLQEFTSQAEKLGYKRLSRTFKNELGCTIYGFTYEKNNWSLNHWFMEIDERMYFDHTYSTDTGRISNKPNKQVWRLKGY